MDHTVVVLGATGHVGLPLAEKLISEGIKVKGIARSVEKLNHLKNRGAEIFSGSMEDSDFLIKVFKGADAVFALSPPLYNRPDFMQVLRQIASKVTEAVKKTKVKYLVLLSSVGAELPTGHGQIACLYDFENMLKEVPGLSTVTIRSAYFMENFLSVIPVIKTAGILPGIFNEDTELAMTATKDIAAEASEYLTKLNFKGFNIRYLLGPRNYSFPKAASIIGAAVNKPDLSYVKISTDEFRKAIINQGFSLNAAGGLIEAFTALNEKRIGQYERNSSNTSPTTFEEFALEVFAKAYKDNE